MRRLYPLCERLAQSDVPVVIEGETGTGKEVLAEALHESGARASGPFVVFDCTAVASSLLESALFGHEKGAFTGALAQRLGVFEQAHGGTLFIDEIGELDAVLQPKLLRAIERGEVQRVGSNRWERVEVRIIAATRRDLDREVRAGRFRDDLFFRLAVGRIDLPPLRRRRGDVAVLTRHFWRQIAGPERLVPPGLLERLEDHAWPGNVRELQNAIARHVAVGDLPDAETLRPSGASSDPIERVLSMDLPSLAPARSSSKSSSVATWRASSIATKATCPAPPPHPASPSGISRSSRPDESNETDTSKLGPLPQGRVRSRGRDKKIKRSGSMRMDPRR